MIVALYGCADAFPQNLKHSDKTVHVVGTQSDNDAADKVIKSIPPVVVLPTFGGIGEQPEALKSDKSTQNIIKSKVGTAIAAIGGSVYYEIDGLHA